MQGINVEEIKRYNDALRSHTERAAKIKAELEINNREIVRICEELTAELGVTVTPENIESIYRENVDKINETLQTGNEVLRRITEEENQINNPINTPNVVTGQIHGQINGQETVDNNINNFGNITI